MKRVVSLDISSSCIGWSLLQEDADTILLKDWGHIKPPSKKKAEKIGLGLSYRLDWAVTHILDLFTSLQPDEVVVEDYAKKFARGKSSANTIITLATFNETISLVWYIISNKEVIRFPVSSIRKKIREKYNKEVKEKEDVLLFVDNTFTNFVILKNRNGNTKKECYDEADAIVAGLAYFC